MVLTAEYRRVVIRIHRLVQDDRFNLRDAERKIIQHTLALNDEIIYRSGLYTSYEITEPIQTTAGVYVFMFMFLYLLLHVRVWKLNRGVG